MPVDLKLVHRTCLLRKAGRTGILRDIRRNIIKAYPIVYLQASVPRKHSQTQNHTQVGGCTSFIDLEEHNQLVFYSLDAVSGCSEGGKVGDISLEKQNMRLWLVDLVMFPSKTL